MFFDFIDNFVDIIVLKNDNPTFPACQGKDYTDFTG